MTPAKYDLVVYQGATLRLPMQYVAGGVPVNITDCSIRAVGRQRYDSGEEAFELSIGQGITVTDPLTGSFTMSLTVAQTMAINFRLGVWNLEITFPEGTVIRVVQGFLTLSKMVQPV